MKEESKEFTTAVYLIIGGACFFASCCIVVGLMMAVMAISFALPLHIFIFLRSAKKRLD